MCSGEQTNKNKWTLDETGNLKKDFAMHLANYRLFLSAGRAVNLFNFTMRNSKGQGSSASPTYLHTPRAFSFYQWE